MSVAEGLDDRAVGSTITMSVGGRFGWRADKLGYQQVLQRGPLVSTLSGAMVEDLRSAISIVRALALADLELLDRVRPDVVVVSGRPTTCAVASALGIANIALVSAPFATSWSHEALLASGSVLARERGYLRMILRRGLAQAGFHPRSTTQAVVEVLADIQEFVGAGAPNALFAGPLLVDDGQCVRWPDGDRRAYITSGSRPLGSEFARAGAELAARGWSVVMAGAGVRSDEARSENILRTTYCRAADAMRAADVVVSHGGSGAVYHAMLAGAPSLYRPVNTEQVAYTELAERAHLGKRWRGAEIARCVDELLTSATQSECTLSALDPAKPYSDVVDLVLRS